MPNTLVIIGHHAEEAEFGEAVRECIGDSRLNFYRVRDSYRNGSSGHKPNAAEIWRAEEEILNAMSLRKPDIAIDVHTAKGRAGMCLAELISLHQFDRLQPVETAGNLYPVEDPMSVHVERFMPFIRDSRLQKQQGFPYVALEVWLRPVDKVPYKAQVEFAARVINEVLVLY